MVAAPDTELPVGDAAEAAGLVSAAGADRSAGEQAFSVSAAAIIAASDKTRFVISISPVGDVMDRLLLVFAVVIAQGGLPQVLRREDHFLFPYSVATSRRAPPWLRCSHR